MHVLIKKFVASLAAKLMKNLKCISRFRMSDPIPYEEVSGFFLNGITSLLRSTGSYW